MILIHLTCIIDTPQHWDYIGLRPRDVGVKQPGSWLRLKFRLQDDIINTAAAAADDDVT